MRNKLGQWATGHPPNQLSKRDEAIPGLQSAIAQLKLAALEAITPEQVKAVMAELYNLCFDETQRTKDRIEAMREFLNRTMGKPEQQIQMHQERVTTNVNYDLHKLSDADLKQLEGLLGKTQLTGPTDAEITIEE